MRSSRSPCLTAAACALLLVVVYVVAVLSTTGQSIDTRVMLVAVAALGDAGWTATVLEVVAPATILAAGCLGLSAVIALRGAAAGTRVAVTVVGTLALSQFLKIVLVRPTLLDGAANSLPSGHVSAVAAVAVAAYVASPRRARRTVVAPGVVAVVATGLATMAHGWHRPSDVLASALLAVGVGATAMALVVPTRRDGSPTGSGSPVMS